jgi:hypothetical protein
MTEIRDPKGAVRKLLAGIVKRNGCWEWTGQSAGNGYGQVQWDGQWYRTHRLAHELFIGPIPEGLFVLHACDNRACCNPDHLSADTQQANMDDMIAKGRGYWPGRTRALTEEQIAEILQMPRRYGAVTNIANRFKVHRSTIHDVLNGQYCR